MLKQEKKPPQKKQSASQSSYRIGLSSSFQQDTKAFPGQPSDKISARGSPLGQTCPTKLPREVSIGGILNQRSGPSAGIFCVDDDMPGLFSS